MDLFGQHEPDLTGWVVSGAVKSRVPSGEAHALVVEMGEQRRAI